MADGAVKKDKLLFETTSTIGLNENLAYFYSNSEIELYFNEKSVFKTRINGELCKNYLGVSVLTYKKKAIFLENFGEKARLHIVNCENDSEDEVVDLGVNERSSFSFAVNEEIKEVMVYSYSCDANGDQSTLFVYSLEDGNELIEKKDDCFTVNGRMVTEICECFSDGNERYFLFKGVVFGNDATKFLFEEERFLCQVLSVETEKME